jgi:hypothetical protein
MGGQSQTLLDELLPSFDVNEVHETWVPAAPERAYAAVREVRPDEVRLARPLMALRSVPGLFTGKSLTLGPSVPFLDQMLGLGFVRLGEREGSELVIGAVGRFWSLAGNRPLGEIRGRDDFVDFDAPGFAKAALNVLVRPAGAGSTVLTETRIVGTDSRARRRFRVYWAVIGPWSALLRRSLLRAVRRRAAASNPSDGP